MVRGLNPALGFYPSLSVSTLGDEGRYLLPLNKLKKVNSTAADETPLFPVLELFL